MTKLSFVVLGLCLIAVTCKNCNKKSALIWWKKARRGSNFSKTVELSSGSWNAVTEGTTATISCKKGYHLEGVEGENTLTCSSGEWGVLPVCSIDKGCNRKRALIWWKKATRGSNFSKLVKLSSGWDAVTEGTTATISCKRGYYLEGESTLTCRNGEWGALPVCSKRNDKDCNQKTALIWWKKARRGSNFGKTVKLSSGSWNAVTEGTTATISCKRGYYLEGESTLTCRSGEWGVLPVCSKENAGGGGLGSILSKGKFERLFPHRNATIYQYKYFLAATKTFPDFANQGTPELRRREVAAFLAHATQETTGWDGTPNQRYYWGLVHVEQLTDEPTEDEPATEIIDEVTDDDLLCTESEEYPCQEGVTYHGRGALQLSYNYNYGQFSETVLKDKLILLKNPERVAQEGLLAFQTALWFWMTPQWNKPSCHDVMVGKWNPTGKDEECGRVAGFGATINIINGGAECGVEEQERTFHRIEGFKHFANKLKTTTGENLSCQEQNNFSFCQ